MPLKLGVSNVTPQRFILRVDNLDFNAMGSQFCLHVCRFESTYNRSILEKLKIHCLSSKNISFRVIREHLHI